ncbi:g4735 [Coccomyxa elongata]
MGKKKKASAPLLEPESRKKSKAANAHEAMSRVEAVAKKKLLKLTYRLQQPGLLLEERARLLSKIEGKLEKLDALPSPQNHGGPAGATASSTLKPTNGIQFRTPARSGATGILGSVTRTPEEEFRRQRRASRFEECMNATPVQEAVTLQAARSAGKQVVYGQNRQLEKEYLRLTSMPTLDTVRPPDVLKRALRHVQQRWLQDADYAYACEQLKSIRQDLTVQLIRNEFTVHVYETHARIALEQGDLAEFNPCLALLQQLYAENIEGNEMEFMAYGLLYAAVTNPKQLAMELRGIPHQALEHPYMKHALQVCLAAARSDTCHLLSLYESAPRMAPYLMDPLLDRLRARLAAALSAFSPSVPLHFAAATSGFDTLRQVGDFLESKGFHALLRSNALLRVDIVDFPRDLVAPSTHDASWRGFEEGLALRLPHFLRHWWPRRAIRLQSSAGDPMDRLLILLALQAIFVTVGGAAESGDTETLLKVKSHFITQGQTEAVLNNLSTWNGTVCNGAGTTWKGVYCQNGTVTSLSMQWGLKGMLPSDLSDLKALSMIKLQQNNLTGPFPEAWSKLGALMYLDLSQNQLTGTLPDSWSDLTLLQILYLYQNNFTGTLPKSWVGMKALSMLGASQNNLTGTLPDSWSDMPRLGSLNVAQNRLTGTLPESWSSMALNFAVFSSNYLTGSLHSSWLNMTGLATLALNNNSLTGRLPSSWSVISNLKELILDANNLTGPLPETWSNLTSMGQLSMANNRLSGTLPASWSGLVNLYGLNLSHNNLEGTLPASWSTLNVLAYNNGSKATTPFIPPDSNIPGSNPLDGFNFAANKLTGTLPPSWSSLVYMGDLYLENNRLTGTLPDSWSNLKDLFHLNLSGNSLTGTIPSSWQNLKQTNIDTSANKLTGTAKSA